jgi:hypothetical protein
MIRLRYLDDTIMKITQRQLEILKIIGAEKNIPSSVIFERLSDKPARVTLKRELTALTSKGYLIQNGAGRGVTYTVPSTSTLFIPIDAKEYCAVEPDLRGGATGYNFEIFETLPDTFFTNEELSVLDAHTVAYRERSSHASDTIHKKELERFVIELSWKSSKIEGNTYTLLDTELLISEGKEAAGHDKQEAVMILNHKKAFDFILAHKKFFNHAIKQSTIEELHKVLVEGLGVSMGIRHSVVGITGSTYRPIDNEHQIREAFGFLYAAIARLKDPYSKALCMLVGISYIQGFEDGNKRTARLSANAVLVANSCAPLSYRSVDEVLYREAMLVFYETQSIVAIKEIFTTQYLFASEQYLLPQ